MLRRPSPQRHLVHHTPNPCVHHPSVAVAVVVVLAAGIRLAGSHRRRIVGQDHHSLVAEVEDHRTLAEVENRHILAAGSLGEDAQRYAGQSVG